MWSTREVAELAGTTVNTVRHYHRAGLLEEPERTSNGYKQYRARHLVRLLQIRRLRDLGVPLAQIETVGTAQGSDSSRALLAIDADLASSIERLQRARAEIRAILDGSTTTDVPAGFEDVADRLSDSDRSLVLVYSQLYDDSAMSDLKRMVASEPAGAGAELDALTPDADEPTRQRIAEALGLSIARHLSDFPWLLEPAEHLSRSPQETQETFLETLGELYNEAQLDVLVRAGALAREQVGAGVTGAAPEPAPPDVPVTGTGGAPEDGGGGSGR
ncbi:helix-turn-helix domain-containing protein [Auraticoccus monumenti]|uniref:DNA-binding transcriptional regulator, MerR family n=1 Tax=Auraticoccus monumenti TaxID=675864 RepID=A0A1G6STB2_9ACTN|nr:MerR family transcriptional regulator [Auraticoccus monumenti]SDD20073.1 DNA-binding transcriptional regulator, MerR family [Auraticoccus monumenti]